MPIDAETRAFLDRLAANPPPPGTIPIERFRAALEAMTASDHPYEEVAAVTDAQTPSGVPVRVYRPQAEGTRPPVVWVHGGSWVRGSVAATDHFLRILANRSACVVVGVDYRLPPESAYPQPVEDVLEAVAWTAGQGEAIGAMSGAVALGGESSGGNLAAAATQLARDRGAPAIGHQVLLSPLLDATCSSDAWARLGRGYGLSAESLAWAAGQYAPGMALADPRLSPLFAADLSGLPPALIITGEYDPIGDDGARYAQALERAGVPVDHRRVPGLIHHAIVAPQAVPLGATTLEATATTMGRWIREQ
jgi:acetyl esterase